MSPEEVSHYLEERRANFLGKRVKTIFNKKPKTPEYSEGGYFDEKEDQEVL